MKTHHPFVQSSGQAKTLIQPWAGLDVEVVTDPAADTQVYDLIGGIHITLPNTRMLLETVISNKISRVDTPMK